MACRAAVYGALVPASRFVPPNGSESKAKSLGRANAAKFVERLCKYPGDQKAIKEAQRHILEAHAERLSKETGETVTVEDIEEGRAPRPKVLDMFAGGGAIPLEALRLGCEAYALDLNPVAHIIELCTLVYPQKYGKPDKNAKGSAPDGTWAGLAKEVEYWGKWVLEKVRAEIGDLYPPIPDPKKKGEKLIPKPQERLEGFESTQGELTIPAGYLTPVAYLWTRTVKCKKHDCGATVPLVRQTWLCKKKDRYVALKIIAPKGQKSVIFEVIEANKENDLGFNPEAFSKAGNTTCPFCGTVADSDYVKAEGCAGQMGKQMMAVVSTRANVRGKVYLSANDLTKFIPKDEDIYLRIEKLCSKSGLSVPFESLVGKMTDQLPAYGMRTFSDAFTQRQILSLLTFVKFVIEAEKLMIQLGLNSNKIKAVSAYLGLLVSRMANFNSSLCLWNYTGGRGVVHSFGRQALAMTWDFPESNPFNRHGANWEGGFESSMAVIESLVSYGYGLNVASVNRGSATKTSLESGIIDSIKGGIHFAGVILKDQKLIVAPGLFLYKLLV